MSISETASGVQYFLYDIIDSSFCGEFLHSMNAVQSNKIEAF